MTTGNRVADGLNEHLNQEAKWEQKQEKISDLNEKIDEIEEQMDYHMGVWDDLDCDLKELKDELRELEA